MALIKARGEQMDGFVRFECETEPRVGDIVKFVGPEGKIAFMRCTEASDDEHSYELVHVTWERWKP